MTELLTAAQMRAIEQAAIQSGFVTGLELMERAGQGVVEAVFEEWPELAEGTRRAVVLCGPGNNGGDGFVVARLLKERGWTVEVFLYGEADRLPPDAKVNYERWGALGAVRAPGSDGVPSVGCTSDLTVDAIFGTGLTRPVSFGEDYAGMALEEDQAMRESTYRVAIDIPSGVCADSGRTLGSPFLANLTVTFHAKKRGHVLGYGPGLCGRLRVADIGIEPEYQNAAFAQPELERVTDGFQTWKSVYGAENLQKPSAEARFQQTHKYTHGHALILSGGFGRTGAARLAARGALRIGAGLVSLGVPGSAQMEVAAQITALMMMRVDDAAGLAEVLGDKRLNALCLGPGLGLERARELVPVALGAGGVEPRPTVLDADALSAFADSPEALFSNLHESCVITPHMGEFARLFPDIVQKLTHTPTKGPAFSKVDAAREAAKRAGCVVLLKGSDTVIAAPGGRASINAAVYERAAPWLATAGSGDVLAGFITGLLARGFDPMQAAETAAWLHVECARSFGPGLIAEDLPEELPKVFQANGL
ncbi:NAD(P)H-hydrate dehydratase [Pacificoceanicola onchidii]|uniref:NAD(P)H-hydrate dehydratase n=1 Tax=Pacificoceanicola onchidii TaxID=2562685 RepID=UPI0010A647AF|nr:NAD(P)H-hydrate dehydratase [Pacificoceanicola onchidii]